MESTTCANEDMPVEKILEAEQAVEPKTETYIETNLGAPSNSVSRRLYTLFRHAGAGGGWGGGGVISLMVTPVLQMETIHFHRLLP